MAIGCSPHRTACIQLYSVMYIYRIRPQKYNNQHASEIGDDLARTFNLLGPPTRNRKRLALGTLCTHIVAVLCAVGCVIYALNAMPVCVDRHSLHTAILAPAEATPPC